MKKEEKLTREEWLRLGAIVKMAELILGEVQYEISRSIGRSKKESETLRTIYYRFKKVQSKLDDMVCRVDNTSKIFGGENTIDGTGVFYGNHGDEFEEQKEYIKEFLKNNYID